MTSLAELLQRLLHPYYILHFAYGSFLVFQHLYLYVIDSPLKDADENALLLMMGLVIWKAYISSTAEELSSVLILYTKAYTIWSLYWSAGMWKVFLYGIGWLILSTLCPQPWYRGPTNLIELTETTFRQEVGAIKKRPSSSSSSSRTTSPSTSTTTMAAIDIKGPRITEIDDQGDKASYWVVMLYAHWSVACLNFEAVLAKLSLQYDAKHLKFGKIDISIYTDLAEEYGVSIDPASLSLPTLVLFKHGVELRRLPELTIQEDKSNTSAVKDTITQLGWSKKPATVIHAFQLDRILAESR